MINAQKSGVSKETTPSKTSIAKVGVFVPCYNMGPYIQEALDSLYKQTFRDFTVIIADDASSDKNTLAELSKINVPQGKIFYEKNNMGLTKIANKYMAKLDAEYIMLFSPDDKMHPDFLKEQVEYLDSHPEAHAVCTWIQEFGDGQELIKYDDDLCKLPYMLVDNHFSGAALMRKTAWLAVGMHDTNKNLYPNLDYELWLAMLEKGFILRTIPKPLFYWRVLRNSLSHGVNAERMLIFRKALLKKYLPLYRQHYDYVMGHYLEKFEKFEKYYAASEEGHDWLDQQYKRLTAENGLLAEENALLKSKLVGAIQRPYLRFVYQKIKDRLKNR